MSILGQWLPIDAFKTSKWDINEIDVDNPPKNIVLLWGYDKYYENISKEPKLWTLEHVWYDILTGERLFSAAQRDSDREHVNVVPLLYMEISPPTHVDNFLG